MLVLLLYRCEGLSMSGMLRWLLLAGPPYAAAGTTRVRKEHSAQGARREAWRQVTARCRQDNLQWRDILLFCSSANCCIRQPGEAVNAAVRNTLIPCNVTVSVGSPLRILLSVCLQPVRSCLVRKSKEYTGQVVSDAAAVQVDNHVAELTVRETLDFGARVLGVGHKEGTLTCALP